MILAYLYLVLINLLDFFTTKLLIARYGFEVELNPFMKYLIVTYDSPHPILLSKIVGLVALGVGLFVLKTYYPDRYALPVWLWVMIGVDVFLTGVVLWAIWLLTVT